MIGAIGWRELNEQHQKEKRQSNRGKLAVFLIFVLLIGLMVRGLLGGICKTVDNDRKYNAKIQQVGGR